MPGGNSFSIFKDENYSSDASFLRVKGADQKGNSYEERINAKTVNPHNSPFIGLMALNTPISPGDGHPQRSSRLGNRGGQG